MALGAQTRPPLPRPNRSALPPSLPPPEQAGQAADADASWGRHSPGGVFPGTRWDFTSGHTLAWFPASEQAAGLAAGLAGPPRDRRAVPWSAPSGQPQRSRNRNLRKAGPGPGPAPGGHTAAVGGPGPSSSGTSLLRASASSSQDGEPPAPRALWLCCSQILWHHLLPRGLRQTLLTVQGLGPVPVPLGPPGRAGAPVASLALPPGQVGGARGFGSRLRW